MKEQRITYETAVLAAQAGFKWDSFESDENYILGYHDWVKEHNSDKVHLVSHYELDTKQHCFVSLGVAAPTQSLLQRWLREKHELHITIEYDFYLFEIVILKWGLEQPIAIKGALSVPNNQTFYNYEDALEHALKASLQLVLDEKVVNSNIETHE